MTKQTETIFDVMLIGAGPAGLACGYWLQQANLSFLILEKDQIGHSWKSHYDNLKLHTLKANSFLPGMTMPESYPTFVPRAEVAAYLDQYAAHFDLPVVESTTVTQVSEVDGVWEIETNHQRFKARILLLTTGIWSKPFIPDFKGIAQFNGEISHAADYKNHSPFADQRVLVVGGGNSATEIAVEISKVAQETAILIRDGASFVNYPSSPVAMNVAATLFRNLPEGISHRLLASGRPDLSHIGINPPPRPLTQVYPVVGLELPEAIERGEVELITSGIGRFDTHGIHFENRAYKEFDHVVMGTGYRPAVDFAAPYFEYGDKGRLLLTKQNRSTIHERLFAAGYTYPNTEGWFQSIPRVSRQTVSAIVRSL